MQQSSGTNGQVDEAPSSSQDNEPVGVTVEKAGQEDDDETLLRELVERFPRKGYFTLTNAGQLLKRRRPLDEALLDALEFRVKIQQIHLTRPQGGRWSRDYWTKADLYNAFQEFISRPCADVKSLNVLLRRQSGRA